jgi:hypothetical protein
LRERRVREELLVLEAGDALARREAAEAATAEASQALHEALDELQQLGFTLDDIATVLEVDVTTIGGVAPPSRRAPARTRRSVPDDGDAAVGEF